MASVRRALKVSFNINLSFLICSSKRFLLWIVVISLFEVTSHRDITKRVTCLGQNRAVFSMCFWQH